MRVDAHIDIDAPADAVWELVGDPSTYPTFMAGVTRWEQRGDTVSGCGARYTARLQIGSAPVGALTEVVEFDAPRDVAWTSITGLDHRGRFRLREVAPGTTRVWFRLAYQAPGGVLGLLADRVAAPMVKGNIDETLRALKERVEGRRVRRPRPFRPLTAALDAARAARVLAAAGIFHPAPPARLLETAGALREWGLNPAAASIVGAARHPDEPALVDDAGMLTFAELDARTNAVADGLQAKGVGPGTVIGILCRNHRGFVEASLGAFKLGADVVYLNTGFSGPQVDDVCGREGIALLVHDEEFTDVARHAGRPTVVAWTDRKNRMKRSPDTLDDLVAACDDQAPRPPARAGRMVILTSGTTGSPKGAPRSQSNTLGPAVALLSRIPLRARDTTVIAPPLFHAWGFANLLLGMALSSTIVLRRRFEPEQFLADIAAHRARVAVVVPVMLQRVMALPDEVRARHDTSSLEVVSASGSALTPALAARFMDEFGDVLYNLYGSTEVAWATTASPAQLRAAPGTVGTPPRGTRVAILDHDGIELPRGRRGRIFVGNDMTFAGYTGGGNKTVLRGLVDSGDMGHFDTAGRLFVDGRSDDMIVSGGENVFPEEVEETLAAHPDIADAAVVGVDDEEFGQRLAAFVVLRPGATVEVADVKDYVRGRLARYKVPRDVEVLDELPRNPTGKVLKRELQSRHNGSA